MLRVLGHFCRRPTGHSVAKLGQQRRSYTPVDAAVSVLQTWHGATGLAWSGSIISLTLAFRASMVPLLVYQTRKTLEFATLFPQFAVLDRKHKEDGHVGVRRVFLTLKGARQVWRNAGLNPIKCVMTPLVQIPIFISLSLAIRRLIQLDSAGFSQQGLFWFSDLTIPDPLYILPVANACFLFINIQSLGLHRIQALSPIQDILSVVVLMALPITTYLPSGLLLYWTTSSAYTLSQSFILRTPLVRNAMAGAQAKEAPSPAPSSKREPDVIVDGTPPQLEGLSPGKRARVEALLKKATDELNHVQDLMARTMGDVTEATPELRDRVQMLIDDEKEAGRVSLPLRAEVVEDDTQRKIIVIRLDKGKTP